MHCLLYTSRNRILAHRDLFELLGETRANGGRPVVISDAPDELVGHTRGYGTGSRPEDYLDAFADYVKTLSLIHIFGDHGKGHYSLAK